MLKPSSIFFLVLLLIFACNGENEISDKDCRNLSYQIGDIPGVDTFKVEDAQEKKMEESISGIDRDVEKLSKKLLGKPVDHTPSDNKPNAKLSFFRNNRSRIILKNFEDSKLVPKDKPFDAGAPALCTCSLNHDSITVRTAAGFFGGFGFLLKLYHEKFDLSYFEEEDGDYLKANLHDTVFTRQVTIESRYQSLILDTQPTFSPGQQLIGLATYTSGKYYKRESGSTIDTVYVKGKFYFTCRVR